MATVEDQELETFKKRMAHVTEAIQEATPGAFVTLIIRFPSHEEGFLVAGADDLDAVADVIRRAKSKTRQP